MEGLAREGEGLLEPLVEAVLDEVEEVGLVGAVELVGGDGVADGGGVDADLVEASGAGMDSGEGVAGGVSKGDEIGLGRLAIVANALLEEDSGVEGAADGAIDGDGSGEEAVEDGGVGFADAAVLDGALKFGAAGGVAGEDDDTGGFAVEPGRHVEDVLAQVLAGGADETGPGAVLGRVADDGAGLVHGDEFGREEEDPAFELGGRDLPAPIGLRHNFSVRVSRGRRQARGRRCRRGRRR